MSERPQRRLAAIVAADVVGYSRHIGADETGTLRTLRAHRAELIDPLIASHGGRIVKTMGDGLLLEFSSMVNAAQCAVEFQRAMAERNLNVPKDRRIEFRIGINLGDILIDEDGDIHGDGVNIAARIEALAAPGGVAISHRAHEDVVDRLDLRFMDSGEHKLKNIARPIRVWKWSAAAGATTRRTEEPDPAPRDIDPTLAKLLDAIRYPTLAVLPFENMSDDAEASFFCDGLAESLITDLSKATRVEVASRNSSFRFKGRAMDIKDLARELNVGFVVEGSVQRMGSRIRVNAQLIDASDGNHVWADRYDRSTDDLFAVQDELCGLIENEVDLALGARALARHRRPLFSSEQAYRHQQLAFRHLTSCEPAALRRGREEADRAAALDPKNPMPWNMMSVLSLVEASFLSSGRKGEKVDEAIACADRSIELKPDDGAGYAFRALAYLLRGDLQAAERDAVRGAEMAPSFPVTTHALGQVRLCQGSLSEANQLLRTSIRQMPAATPRAFNALAVCCLLRGRVTDAVIVLEKAQQYVRKQLPDGHALLAGAYTALDRRVDAEASLAEALNMKANLTIHDIMTGWPFADDDHRDALSSILRQAGVPDR